MNSNADPTLRNRVPDSSTFSASANVKPTEVQWKDLALEEFVNFSKYEFLLFWCELIISGELTENIRDLRYVC